MAGPFGLWSGRRYFLNKMTLRELIVAYFTHHSILTYIVLIAGSTWLAVAHSTAPWGPLGAAAAIVLLVIVLSMNAVAIFLRNRYRRQW